VAVSLLLLIGTGLLVKSLMNLRDLAPGFRTPRLLMVRVAPGSSGYKGQRLRDFYERLQQHLQTLPWVEVASLAAIQNLKFPDRILAFFRLPQPPIGPLF
jgi:putative ABC transport system permease protein